MAYVLVGSYTVSLFRRGMAAGDTVQINGKRWPWPISGQFNVIRFKGRSKPTAMSASPFKTTKINDLDQSCSYLPVLTAVCT